MDEKGRSKSRPTTHREYTWTVDETHTHTNLHPSKNRLLLEGTDLSGRAHRTSCPSDRHPTPQSLTPTPSPRTLFFSFTFSFVTRRPRNPYPTTPVTKFSSSRVLLNPSPPRTPEPLSRETLRGHRTDEVQDPGSDTTQTPFPVRVRDRGDRNLPVSPEPTHTGPNHNDPCPGKNGGP